MASSYRKSPIGWFSVIYACCILTASTAQAQAPAADSSGVECSLRLAAKERIYQFSCTGGYVTAAAGSPSVLRLLGGPDRSAGVKWSADNCGLPPGSCAIAICDIHSSRPGNNSAALTLQLELSGLELKSLGVDSNQTASWKYKYYYMYEDRVQTLSGLVCLAGNTTAMLPKVLVQNNNATGLFISGASDVTITYGTFLGNTKATDPGAVFIAAGKARVKVLSSAFVNNTANELYNPQGGAIMAMEDAAVSLQGCTFERNQAYYGHGGAAKVTGRAKLAVEDSTFSKHIAVFGAAIAADGNASVTITGSTLQEGWGSFGGALSVSEHANVTLTNTQVIHNYVKDYLTQPMGGGCYLREAGRMLLVNTTVYNNSADIGGGIAIASKRAQLRIDAVAPLSEITGNTARQGGGIFTRGIIDTLELATHVTIRNKATIGDDIGTPITNITVLDAPRVYVPLLGDNKGLLPIKVRLSWGNDLPGSGEVQAVLNGRPLVKNLSSPVTGVAVLNVNLQENPGNYTLILSVRGSLNLSEVWTKLDVQVVPCGPGQINVTGGVCNSCPRGSYNLDPSAKECSRCPLHAFCDGATVIPRQGYWSSSLRSDQVHRCLYPPACEQATTGTWMQQAQQLRASFEGHSNQAFLAAQCAVGHEGPLCSRCSAGYGQSMLATVGKCQRCASAAQIITLYLLAALATLLLINLLCYLNSGQRGSNQPSGATPTNNASGSPWLQSSSQPSLSSQGSGVPLTAGVGGKSDQGGVVHISSNCTSASGQVALAASGTQAASTPGAPGPGEQLASEVLKCFVIYMQWMLVVASVKVEYPPALLVPFSALSWFFQASSSATGLDCLLGTKQGALPLSVRKVLVNLLVPVVMLATLLLLDVLTARVRRYSWQRRRRGALALGNQHVFRGRGAVARTAIVTVFFFLPSLLRTTYGLFACLPLDRASPPGPSFAQLQAIGSYWMLDIDQACFEGTHLKWSLGLGIPLLLVLCIVVPFGIVVYLSRCRRNDVLEEQYYIAHFGFLYGSYKRSRCYWEGVIAMQTCVIMAISVFGATLSAPYQCILLNAAFGVSLLLLAVFRPYAHQDSNVMAMQSCACLLLTAQAPLLFALMKAEGQADEMAANAVAAVFMLINMAFVLSAAWRLVRAVNWSQLVKAVQQLLARSRILWGKLCQPRGRR